MEKNYIREVREKKGITAKELADKTGIGKSNVYSIERGELYCFPGWMEKISKALNVPEEELFEEGYGNQGMKLTRLKYERWKSGYTLRDIAKITKIQRRHLSTLENGRLTKTYRSWGNRLSKLFRIPIEELLKEVDTEKEDEMGWRGFLQRCDAGTPEESVYTDGNIIEENLVKMARKEKGLTLDELLKVTGIPKPNLSDIELRRVHCPPAWRKKLSDALEVSVEELFEHGDGKRSFPKKMTRLRYERLKRGYTIKDTEELSGIPSGMLCKLEIGRSIRLIPKWGEKLSKIFGIPAEDLLKGAKKDGME